MRVAVDVQGLATNVTGVRTYIKNLVAALGQSSEEHQYDLLSLSPERLAVGPVPRWKRACERLALVIWTQMLLPLRLALGRYDALLSPDATAPLWSPCPRVVVVHDAYYRTRPHAYGRFWGLLYRSILEPALRRANVVVTVSQAARTDLIRQLSIAPERVAVVYEAADNRIAATSTCSTHAASVRQRFGLLNRPYVLFVGTMEERKNVPRLIRAFARARSTLNPETVLLLVGRPSWRKADNDAVELAIAETGTEQAILRTGFVADEDLPGLYAGASLFLFPSLSEGFGIPVLDAMRSGVPVVTSTAGSLPEVAGDAAILVDPLDVDAIASAIGRVLSDGSLREQLVTAGYQQAARFSWSNTARAMERVLKSVAHRA